ncbi:MAG: hypothetical protein Q8T09_17990 [Candidatus Melainabacteria bacterium]|nr:hypothetical protein [Candidatus Melainabacteria bacterium]
MSKFFIHAALVFFLLSLTACSKAVVTQRHTISASVAVPVTDSVIRRLTEITSSIDIIAAGDFSPGNYQINHMLVTIQPNTSFHLKLSLPIKDPSSLSTNFATGSFESSQPITVNSIPVPKAIDLTEGKVSAEIDFVRTISAFLVGLLQASGESGDLRAMIDSMQIEKAVLSLRPGSMLKMAEREICIGPQSTFRLENVVVDRDLNYRGQCTLNLNFAKGCRWIGKKVNCEFDGGVATLHMVAAKENDELVLSLDKEQPGLQKLTLLPCTFRFGKNKRSVAISRSVGISVRDLNWRHGQGDAYSRLHMLGLMDLRGTNLDLKTDRHETVAMFPDSVHANLEIAEDEKGKSTHFATTGLARAAQGKITIAKKATKLILHLAEAVIGPVSFDKTGTLQFILENGSARLKRLEWQGNKSRFSLVTTGSSTLSVPDGMLIETADGAGTRLVMPIAVRLGEATLKGAGGDIKLTNLTGELNVEVDHEVQISSKLDFSIPDSKLFSNQQADVKVRGLDLLSSQGKTVLSLRNCSVVVPEQAIIEAVLKHLPTHFDFDLNKQLTENKKWRYKNAVARRVVVDNFKVTEINAAPPDLFNFEAEADAKLDGTVEKTALIGGGSSKSKESESVLADQPEAEAGSSKWETKPWNLSGHVEGSGKVKYRFKPSGKGLKSQLVYDLELEVPLSGDINLDWSKVAGGILKFAERRVIVSHLRKVTVPIKHQGQIELFAKGDSLSRNLNIVKLAVKPVNSDMQIDFSAQGNF